MGHFKKAFSLFLITGLVLITFSVKSQIVSGTPAAVNKALMINNLLKTYQSLVEYSSAKTNLNGLIANARQKYWAEFPNGKNIEEARKHFSHYLLVKDMLCFYIDFLDYYHKGMSTKNTGSNASHSFSDIINLVSGGQIDGGIEPSAKGIFTYWTNEVKYTWSTTAKGMMDIDALNKALEHNIEIYLEYVGKRDRSEYLFNNPNSPLLSTDPATYLKGFLLTTNVTKDYDEANKYTNGLLKLISPAQLTTAINDFKINYIEYYSPYVTDLGLNTLKPDVIYYPFYCHLEWEIAKNSKQLYFLYLVKRKYGCDWGTAKDILNNRIKRYGAAQMEKIMVSLWANASNKDSTCFGSPYLTNVKHGELRSKRIPTSEKNEDCIVKVLGPTVVAYDLFDIAAQKANKESLKNQLIEKLKQTPQLDSLNLLSAAERYNNIIKVFDEKLLLYAIYLQNEMSIGFISALNEQTEIPNRKFYKEGGHPHSHIKDFLIMFSVLTNNYKPIAAITTHYFTPEKKGVNQLERNAQGYKDIAMKYGEEKFLELMKQSGMKIYPRIYRNDGLMDVPYYEAKSLIGVQPSN